MASIRLPGNQCEDCFRSLLEAIAYAEFEEMDTEIGRRIDGRRGVLATELQRVGGLKAVAQMDGSGIGKPVAHSRAELIGERGIGGGRPGTYPGGSRGRSDGGVPPARAKASETRRATALLSYFTSPISTPDEAEAAADIRRPAGTGIKIVPNIHHGAQLVGRAGYGNGCFTRKSERRRRCRQRRGNSAVGQLADVGPGEK